MTIHMAYSDARFIPPMTEVRTSEKKAGESFAGRWAHLAGHAVTLRQDGRSMDEIQLTLSVSPEFAANLVQAGKLLALVAKDDALAARRLAQRPLDEASRLYVRYIGKRSKVLNELNPKTRALEMIHAA